MKIDYEILIVGAGVVGATLAFLLAKQGIQTCLVDQRNTQDYSKKNYFTGRTASLNLSSIELFEKIGIWKNLIKFSTKFRRMFIWDGEGSSSIEFLAKDIEEDVLGYIATNNSIVSEMFKKYSSLPNLTILEGEGIESFKQEENNIESLLSTGKKISSKLVVGADGLFSSVRKLSSIPIRSWSYNQTAITGSLSSSEYHEETAWQVFTSSGPLALLPFENKSDSNLSFVWSVHSHEIKELIESKKNLLSNLERATEMRLGNLNLVGEVYSFPLNQLHAKKYFSNRAVLVGDAAHTIHPLAGQGMNLGISDLVALSKVLSCARRKGMDIGSGKVLSEYDKERQKYNLRMLALMEVFKHGFENNNPWIKLGRNFIFDLTANNKELKKLFIKGAAGII